MKNLRMLVAVVAVFVFVFTAGCSSLQSSNKPSVEVQRELAKKSLTDLLKEKGSSVEIETSAAHKITNVAVTEPHFSEISVNENVERTDRNGVKKRMWAVDIKATPEVFYTVTFLETVKVYKRVEEIKYKMFCFKDKNGNYVFENGGIDEHNVKSECWS